MSADISVTIVSQASDRERAYDIRRAVFQVEQGVPADEEFDDDDERAIHVLATVGGHAAGTGRIVFHPAYAKIGRMAVHRQFRRQGVGRAIIERLMQMGSERGATRFVLHAQVHAIPFYEAAGFTVVGEEFEEAGIPHRRMELSIG